MPLPKRRTSKSRKNMRRSHHALTRQSLSTCPKCDQVKLPHRVCENCGTYNGRQVVSTEES